MHIHPSTNLQLASLGAARAQSWEIQAKRAAEVRRKLSAASRVFDRSEEFSGAANQVQEQTYGAEQRHGGEQRHGDDDAFGRLCSAEA